MTKKEILEALAKENITDLDSLAEFAANKNSKVDPSKKVNEDTPVGSVLIHRGYVYWV